MTVQELIAKLEDYGDHLEVLVEVRDGVKKEIYDIQTGDGPDQMIAVIISI